MHGKIQQKLYRKPPTAWLEYTVDKKSNWLQMQMGTTFGRGQIFKGYYFGRGLLAQSSAKHDFVICKKKK